MLNKNTKIKVRNRSMGRVVYEIPDMNHFKRAFSVGEVKELPYEELQKLSYIPGGAYLLQHYLVIDNQEARDEILGAVELEYDYDEKDIKHLLLNGSVDQLLDCLDFAPSGVVELVKKIAVDIKLNDISKREAILDKTGFSIDKAVAINKITEEPVAEKAATTGRRVTATADTTEKSEEAPKLERRFVVNKK